MKESKDKKWTDSWFYRWFLNNQAVVVLLITLLVFLVIFLFSKISSIFTPLISFATILMLPLVISTILYYLTKPLVSFVEKRTGLSRTSSIFLVFALIVLLIIWGLSGFIPMLQRQIISFIENLPSYVASLDKQSETWLDNPWLNAYQSQLESILSDVSSKAVTYAESFSKNAFSWVGQFAGAITRVTVAIIISPFILFYFLRDNGKMKEGLLKAVPTKLRQPTARVLGDINQQLEGYVQGQVTVAIVVGIMFSVMFSIVNLKYGIALGIIAGFLNMIPYLGSFLAMIPVVIMALVAGPLMLVKVLIIFVIEQTIEGRFVTPLVLGSKLNIHPITIMFILLVAGTMFGVWGVFLGIPAYASVKVLVKEVFTWYKAVSGLYPDEESEDLEGHVE
ncbi:AI-2E family transporter [Streptococcus loxodontisalivarius]|uniref:PurR-regulated permease PerM n=1 Tax=Streptococcus loxodontisalivarius TaxID=1349415 RepID=A0ABS2PRJ0_9STRE|nr:AI-2E family transporter [Streptococcus loxodontisalivarius]MBM7642659.1 putative PurR-regulated permease PerM [Streptococcus loxodontisalivarius]